VFEAVRNFRHILEAQHCRTYTDHKPLVYAFTQRRETLPAVQFNQLTFIPQFTTDVVRVSGAANVVSDCLSRIEAVSWAPAQQDIAAAQAEDPEMRHYLGPTSALQLQRVVLPGTNMFVTRDVSRGRPRPFVPGPLRRAVFAALHGLSHPGAAATITLVTELFVWPSGKKACREWTRGVSTLPARQGHATRLPSPLIRIAETVFINTVAPSLVGSDST
jgi:hypothetical protein